jgi:hypothetical protein
MRIFLAGAILATTLLASVAAAAPGTPSSRSRATSGPVHALAADGQRAAFVVEGKFKECLSVMLWDPLRRRAVALQAARTCETNDRGGRTGPPAVALAGTRAVWLQLSGGNTLETIVRTATLARPTPVWIAAGFAHDGVYGTFASRPFGDGALGAFTIEQRCDADAEANGSSEHQCPPGRTTGDIVAATVWRVGGRDRCPNAERRESIRCSAVAKADGELTVLAVDAGRIAVRTQSGVRLLTADGRALQEFDVSALGAALSGTRLAVRTASAIEVYDTRTGVLAARIGVPSGVRLQDLDRGILVTASSATVTLRRLGDGRARTLRVGRTALAQLEPSGLFVAGARRVTFMPMTDVLRRLGGSS